MSKKEFARKFAPIVQQLEQLSAEAERVGNWPISSMEDAERTRKGFLEVASKFKEVEKQHNSIPAPKGYEAEVEELREIFTEYVDCIYQKSDNFTLQGIEDGTVDHWSKKELEASAKLSTKTKELAKKMF